MFIYLPLWFSFGAIFYLALRVATARVGGSLNGPTLAVLSAIALLVLVFASVLQPVARVGLALAALAVGAVAASLLWGQPSKSDSGPVNRDGDAGKFADVLRKLVGPESQAPPEREKLDIGRALIVGAAALFVAFAALQYDYNLLRSVTKFSAGEVVSVEFGQNIKKGSSFSQTSGGQNIAALPRTESINYITWQLARMNKYINDDTSISRQIIGLDTHVLYADPQLDYFLGFMDDCVIPLAISLQELQQEYNSEFPALSGIGRISILARRLYLIVDRGSQNDISAIIELQEGNKQFSLPGISEAFTNYMKEVDFDLRLLNYHSRNLNSKMGVDVCKVDDHNNIASLNEFLNFGTFNRNNIVNADNDKLNKFSDTLGYLSILVSFSEFADGNRESAIQLIDNRIDDELKKVKELENKTFSIVFKSRPAQPAGVKNDEREYSRYREYLVVRKKNMIRRLIRWELSLINFVQTPPQSTVLDEIAFTRAFLEVDLFRSFDRLTAQMTGSLEDLERRIPRNINADCFPKVTGTGDDRSAFLTTIYTHTLIMNNILTISGRNSAIVISRDNKSLTGLASSEFGSDGRQRLGQSDLLKQLDQFGGV